MTAPSPPASGAATTTPTFAISGGAYGGARVRIEGNHIIAPPNAAVHANGNLFDMRMNGNTFESPTTQQDGYPHISLGGVQGGSFSRNVVWCSATKTTLALGSSSGFDLLNQPLIGTTSFFDVDHNIFRGAADGIPVISLSSGQNRNITYNRVFQASPLGAGNAIFIESMNGSGGGDQADWNDTSQIDGSPYTAQSGNAPAVLIGSFERFQSSACRSRRGSASDHRSAGPCCLYRRADRGGSSARAPAHCKPAGAKRGDD